MIALLLQYYASRLKVVSINRHIKQRQYGACQMIDESSKAREQELNVPSGSQFSLIGQLGFRSGPHRHGVTLVSSLRDSRHVVFFLNLSDEIGT